MEEIRIRLAAPPQAAGFMALYRRWIDAERLASVTPRVSLAAPVAALQALQREAEGLAVPTCLTPAKQALEVLIRMNAEAMLAFLGKSNTEAQVYETFTRRKLVPMVEQAVSEARC